MQSWGDRHSSINPAIIDLAFLSLEPLKAFYPVLQL
jgi:hypothetical protein